LNEAKTKVENEDFGDLTSLMNGILESINSKKQEYLGGQSSQKLKDMQDRYKELEKEGIELDEVSGLMEDAASAHEKGNYETAKTLLSEARQKAENNYILTKSSAFKDTYDSILKDIGKWKEASIDTAELERIIEDARNKIELKEMEMASKDLDQAMEISSRLREYYYQERSLDIISEAKITFRDLIEVGQDISSLRGQLDRVKEYFSDQQYKEAYELGEELTSTIKARRRLGTLQKKNQLLVKRHAELENEGLELDEEKDVLSQVAVMLDAAEFDTAKETIEKIDRVMEEKFHSYRDDFYRKEIDEFKSLLDKFSKKDVDVSSLYSIIDNCTRHLEMKEYNTTAELLKKGWMEAESARDFFVTNQLLTQLYELEDALFELANRGADVTGMDSKLLKIKRMISKGSFSEARSAILKRQKDIREIEIDFHRGKVRIFLDELETQRQSLSEEGVDTMEMETLLVAAESNVSKGIFDEAYKVIDKVKKIRDSLELDHKLGNSESSLDTVKEELDRLSTKGVDTDLMGDLYRDAGELLKKNNFSEVNAYCKLALKEGAKREREFDLEIALDRLSRSRGVVEFIEKDSGGGFDLSDYFDRLDELNDEVREEVSTEILARIVQFEDDVRGRSREYMKQKAISTKRLLEDIISEIEEIGGASSPLMVYIQKGEKLLDKEHFGPSIEWFQKGIEKAAFEKRRQEICLSIDNIRTLEEDARKIGVDVSEGSSLFNKGKREFKREDYDKSVILLERAKKAITSAKFNYLKTKINGVIITNKLIYDNLTEMGVSKIEMKEEKSFMDMSQLLLDKGVLDEAEVYVNKGKEALVDLKNRHNLRIVSEEMEKTSDICSGIEEQGVEISSSLQLLGEIRETLGDRKELPDDEQRSILDDIRHALHSAREQETTFKLHLLDSNLERNAALLNKYSMEGVDMTEPLAILAEAREMYDGGNTEKGLAKGIECIALAKEKRALFFKDSANGLLYTAELLMKDIRKLPFDISHLESMMKTARDNYAEEKHRKCAHQLKPFISACDEMRIMGELQAKIDALRESVIDLPIEKEHFEEELKEIEELIVNRKFDAAKNAYEDIFKVFKLKRGEYEKKLAEEEYERIKLQVDELTADGIDQSEPINMIEQGRKFIKNGELNKGHDIIMEAAQLAKKIRKEKTAEISEAILSLEDALILAGEGRAYEAELMKKLRKLRDDSAIPITEELTQTILSLSKIFKMMEDYEIKTLFLGNVQSVRKLLSEVSEYLPEEISRELNVKLDGMPSLGPGVPRSVEDEAFGELEKIRNLIIASTEKEIHKSLADPVARIEQLGGVDKLLAQGIVGVDIYNSYLNKINDTSGEELVDKLRFVRLLSEQVEKIELRVQRKNLLDHYNDLSQRVNAMKSNQFTPSSALHWLGEGKAALDSDEFKEAEKCFVRAEDGANMALKRREQDMASRSITSAIEKMRGMGLKFSEAKEVQVILIKAQEAERQRRYSEIQGLCKEAIGLATKEIDRKRKEKFEKETSRIKNIIKSKDRDMDGSIHLNRLVMAENLFNSGMYDLAMDVAKRAEKDVRNSYWLTMTEKYLISHQEAEKAMENAETIEVDISQGALLMEESRKLFLKEAMALAYENISEATSVINELIHRNMVRTKQDEATSLRKELDILEEKGAEVLNARRDLEKMRVLLKQGELDKAEEVKNIIVNALGGLEKDVFREELKRILDNCHAIMEEVARMKGDTSEFQKNIKRATDFLTGGLLESANELSQACLKELMGERNSLLEERAKTVLYATGEIVNGTENERALDYFKKARTAFELERYKEALRMAQESIKHIEG